MEYISRLFLHFAVLFAFTNTAFAEEINSNLDKKVDGIIEKGFEEVFSRLTRECLNDKATSCFDAGTFSNGGDWALALKLHTIGCDGGYPNNCGRVSYMFLVGEGPKPNISMSYECAVLACEGSDEAGCYNAGLLVEDANLIKMDRPAA